MSKCECKNCVHEKVCRTREFPSIDEILKDGCPHYKDKSLFVELPCKVGDTVYISDFTEVIEAFVSNIEMFYNYLTKEIENVVEVRIIGNFSIHKNFKDFGETVFLTQAEAEEKLNEQKRL